MKLSKISLNRAVRILKNGGVVVCPTDTVYGFLADASNKKAVDKIFKIKKRPRSKPLPIFVKDLKMAKELAEISEKQAKILQKFWPGKYTFILKSKIKNQNSKLKTKNKKLYGVAETTIAIRMPKYKFLNDLLKKADRPLVQTSVNISGKEALIKIREIIQQFKKDKRLSLIIDAGDLKEAKPSKIIDLTTRHLTRLR